MIPQAAPAESSLGDNHENIPFLSRPFPDLRYRGRPSSTRKPMERRGLAGGAMSWRMASKATLNWEGHSL